MVMVKETMMNICFKWETNTSLMCESPVFCRLIHELSRSLCYVTSLPPFFCHEFLQFSAVLHDSLTSATFTLSNSLSPCMFHSNMDSYTLYINCYFTVTFDVYRSTAKAITPKSYCTWPGLLWSEVCPALVGGAWSM